jgi:hypothetical protein
MWTSGKAGSMKRKRYTDEQIAYALRPPESIKSVGSGTYLAPIWHLSYFK